jgi:DNA-binding transcriptional LysR family regulator
MELRHLRCFVAVAENLSFRKAAQRLHVSQPALSRTIRHLEDETGVPLFARSKRSVQLTPGGRSLLTDARRLLREAEAAVTRARQCAHGVHATLRVGVSESLEETARIKRALPAFRREFPEVKLELHELFSTHQVENLRKHDLDAGLMLNPPQDAAFVVVPLEELGFRLAVPAKSPLAKKSSVHLRELAGESFFHFPRHWWPSLYDRYLELCRQAGFEMKIREEAGRSDTRLRRVAAGAGVMILLAHVAARKLPGVAFIKLLDWPVLYQTHLVWRRDDRSPLLAAFVKHLLPAGWLPAGGLAHRN